MKAKIFSHLIVILIFICGIYCQDKAICISTITINNINYCCTTGIISISNLACKCCSTPASCTNCILLSDTTTKPTQVTTTSTKLTTPTTTVVTTKQALSTTKGINCPGSLTISTSNINGVIVQQCKCCVTSSLCFSCNEEAFGTTTIPISTSKPSTQSSPTKPPTMNNRANQLNLSSFFAVILLTAFFVKNVFN